MNDKRAFVRVNLVLDRALSAWLDQQAAAIQQASGAALNRSEIVRAALRAVHEFELACFKPQNEDQLAALLIAIVRAGKQSMRW